MSEPAIVTRARWLVDELYPGLDPSKACLYNTFGVIVAAKSCGYNVIPQAGTMSWPMVAPEEDDGISATHWSYVWDPHGLPTAISVATGNLPEIHVWAALVDTHEIIDISTRGFKTAAEAHGYKWSAPDPPDYLWTKEPPSNTVYKPVLEACKFATTMIIKLARTHSWDLKRLKNL